MLVERKAEQQACKNLHHLSPKRLFLKQCKNRINGKHKPLAPYVGWEGA